jgi:Holliday junction resolvase
MEQLWSEQKYMQLLLREGTVGSDAFKAAVERQLVYFEDELGVDLVRLAKANNTGIYRPDLVARSITRLVFAMGASALDLPKEKRRQAVEDLIVMVRMIVVGTQTIAEGRAKID